MVARLSGAPAELVEAIQLEEQRYARHIHDIGTTSSDDKFQLVIANDLDDLLSDRHPANVHVLGCWVTFIPALRLAI